MRRFLACAALMLPLVLPGPRRVGAQDPKALPEVLWRAPGRMTAQDWVCGPGGCGRTPKPPFRFLRQENSGTSPKVRVRDANGRVWSVKFGAEAIPECFNSRFVTAVGYTAEPTYFIDRGTIENVGEVRRPVRHVLKEDGSFAKARFELRDEKYLVFLPDRKWAWNANPFIGTPQLAGLKILMMLLSNWDAKDARDGGDSNNAAFRWTDSGRSEVLYSVFDWGAALGRWGSPRRRDKSDCAGFAADTPRFIEGVRNGEVLFGYSGKHAEDLKAGITTADIRWLLPYLRRIAPENLRTGLAASGATPRQARCWSFAILDRIRQLQEVGQPIDTAPRASASGIRNRY